MRKFSEFKELSSFFYREILPNTEICLNPKMWIENYETVKASLTIAREILERKTENYKSLDDIKEDFIKKIQEKWLKNGQVLWPVRAALSWEISSPWAFECIFILWIKKSMQRIEQILKVLK